MEPGFGWVDVVYAVARFFILASLFCFLYQMGRVWRLLEIWSPETLQTLIGRGRDGSSRPWPESARIMRIIFRVPFSGEKGE